MQEKSQFVRVVFIHNKESTKKAIHFNNMQNKINKSFMNKGYSEAGTNLHKRSLRSFVPNPGSPVEDIDANNCNIALLQHASAGEIAVYSRSCCYSGYKNNAYKRYRQGFNLEKQYKPTNIKHVRRSRRIIKQKNIMMRILKFPPKPNV